MAGMRPIASTPNLLGQGATGKVYPTRAEDYELQEECGRGMSATVWKAICKPLGEVVAIKLLDLESLNVRIEEIIREAQTMKLAQHPNILPLLCSFVDGPKLWMVEPYVSGGSALNIIKYAYPNGLDEAVIAVIGREVLKGLEYMHKNGMIHRDVKAGNILIDGNGHVMLADFGVAATLERTASWGQAYGNRGTFVGTPCWMAPEVLEKGGEGTGGYAYAADIWSFGITIFELAHGHAPFAKYPPLKVFMMILQQEPPSLDSEGGDRKFSKLMKEVVKMCLQKNPEERPSAARLLEHKFFKTSHDSPFVKRIVLEGLPTLPDRVKALRSGNAPSAATCEQTRSQALESRAQYVAGVSSWNFDLAEIKRQAEAMDEIAEEEDEEEEPEGGGAPPAAAAAGGPVPSSPQQFTRGQLASFPVELGSVETTPVLEPSLGPGAGRPPKPPTLQVPETYPSPPVAHPHGDLSRTSASVALESARSNQSQGGPITQKKGRFEIVVTDDQQGPSPRSSIDLQGPPPASYASVLQGGNPRGSISVPNLNTAEAGPGSGAAGPEAEGGRTQRVQKTGRFEITVDEETSPSPPGFLDRRGPPSGAAPGRPPLGNSNFSLGQPAAGGQGPSLSRPNSQGHGVSAPSPKDGTVNGVHHQGAGPAQGGHQAVQHAAQVLLPDLEAVQRQINDAQSLLARLCRTVVEVERTGMVANQGGAPGNPQGASGSQPGPSMLRSGSATRTGSREGSRPSSPGVLSPTGSHSHATVVSPPEAPRTSVDVSLENEYLRRRVQQLEQLLAKNSIKF